jgi:hypothetical protein
MIALESRRFHPIQIARSFRSQEHYVHTPTQFSRSSAELKALRTVKLDVNYETPATTPAFEAVWDKLDAWFAKATDVPLEEVEIRIEWMRARTNFQPPTVEIFKEWLPRLVAQRGTAYAYSSTAATAMPH